MRDSPDGRFIATFDDSIEIGMGGPACGVLVVRQKDQKGRVLRLADAGASFVWSSDSKAIAFPRWTVDRGQELCVVWVPDGAIDRFEERFSVLQLESFQDYRLIGVDSPVDRPRLIDIQFEKPRSR